MGDHGLKDAVMWKTVDSRIRGKQRLYSSTDTDKIDELVDRIEFENQHESGQPDQNAADMKRQHRLNCPMSPVQIPDMLRSFICPQDRCHHPADQCPSLQG